MVVASESVKLPQLCYDRQSVYTINNQLKSVKMCLISADKKEHICRKDKVVYKLLTSDFVSVSQDFKYRKNKLYKTKILLDEKPKGWMGIRWQHSCADTHEDNYLNSKYPGWAFGREDLLYLSQGFHSYLTMKRLYLTSMRFNKLCVECILPKGTKYFKSETGLLVSDQIIIKGEYSKGKHIAS